MKTPAFFRIVPLEWKLNQYLLKSVAEAGKSHSGRVASSLSSKAEGAARTSDSDGTAQLRETQEIVLVLMISQLRALVHLRESILRSPYHTTISPCPAAGTHARAPRLCPLATSSWGFPGDAVRFVLFPAIAFSVSTAAFFLAVAGASVPVGSSLPDHHSCLWRWFQDTSNPSQHFHLSDSLQHKTEAPRAMVVCVCVCVCVF